MNKCIYIYDCHIYAFCCIDVVFISKFTRLSLLCGNTMVFSRLLRTIFHRSFRILFSTVFSQMSAKILRLEQTQTQKVVSQKLQ